MSRKNFCLTGGREDFGLEIQPTAYCALDALEGSIKRDVKKKLLP
jgi:hypothetical protein